MRRAVHSLCLTPKLPRHLQRRLIVHSHIDSTPMARTNFTAAPSCCKSITTSLRPQMSLSPAARHLVKPTCTRQLQTTSQHWRFPYPAQRFSGKPAAAAFSTSVVRSDSATTQSSTQAQTPQLTWNDFLKMRRTRRYVNLFTSVGTAVGSVAVTAPLALQYEVDNQIASVTGLDPFIALGLTITAVGGFGWLMGPFVGNARFLLYNRRIKDSIAKVRSGWALLRRGQRSNEFAERERFLRPHQALQS